MRWRNLLFILLVALAGCKEEKLALGEPAPQLAAFDSQGHEAKLDAWQGKGVYLNFWSVSCGGCMAEMHTLEKLSQQWGDKLVVVAVKKPIKVQQVAVVQEVELLMMELQAQVTKAVTLQ